MYLSFRRSSLLGLASLFVSGCATVNHPYLYKVERSGARYVLLGTLHTGVGISDLPSIVNQELTSSSRAFFETDIDADGLAANLDREPTPEESARYFRIHYLAHGSEAHLDQVIGPTYWQKLLARLPKVDPKTLRVMNPAGALALLRGTETAKVSRYDSKRLNPYHSMDLNLEVVARKAGVPIVALDSDREVCAFEKGSGSPGDLKAALDGRSFQDDVDAKLQMMDSYQNGDDEALRQHLIISDEIGGRCFLRKRNELWADKLDRMARAGKKDFVAVGIAHILSPSAPSLLELLRKKGFSVERISP